MNAPKMISASVRSPEEVIGLVLDEEAGNPDRKDVAHKVAARLALALYSVSKPEAPVVIRPRVTDLEWATIRLAPIQPKRQDEPLPRGVSPEINLCDLAGILQAGGSMKLYLVLIQAGIETVARLLEHEPSELLLFRGFGERSLTTLRRLLADQGLYLKGDYQEYRRITREIDGQ